MAGCCTTCSGTSPRRPEHGAEPKAGAGGFPALFLCPAARAHIPPAAPAPAKPCPAHIAALSLRLPGHGDGPRRAGPKTTVLAQSFWHKVLCPTAAVRAARGERDRRAQICAGAPRSSLHVQRGALHRERPTQGIHCRFAPPRCGPSYRTFAAGARSGKRHTGNMRTLRTPVADARYLLHLQRHPERRAVGRKCSAVMASCGLRFVADPTPWPVLRLCRQNGLKLQREGVSRHDRSFIRPN